MDGSDKGTRAGGRLPLILAFLAGIVVAGWWWRRQVAELIAKRGRYLRRRAHVDRPVLIVNRWSGDGKAEQYGLVAEATKRGIETVVLERGDDLASLAQAAVARGADALGMAGGDGSLGLIAGVALEHDLPFFCIPVGTRNHFALDLGLDRGDPLAALAALSDGEELLIDYGLVGDRVFLNNVSFGVYAEAVAKEEYRGAKATTIVETALAGLEPEGATPDVRFITPDGREHDTASVLLVSNNRYVLSGPPDYGRRDRLDQGVLGIAAVTRAAKGALERERDMLEWEVSSYSVDAAGGSVRAGVDGEALAFPTPLELRVKPKALRVLVPRGTRPGYISPSQHLTIELFDLMSLAGEPEPADR